MFVNTAGLDTFRCYCCEDLFPTLVKNEHHKIKRAQGGQDTTDNLVLICTNCHTSLHNIEKALLNAKRRLLIPDLLQSLFPSKPKSRETLLYLATTAALAEDSRNTTNLPAISRPDYAMWDTEDKVHLTPPTVSPKVRDLVVQVCATMKNPGTGKRLGIGTYLRLLVEQDLRRRGLIG